jgi:hypothetical protein
MTLSQQEKELAVEIGFDKEVLEIIKQECQAKIQKLHLEQEVYLKDDELSYLNEVLPEHYFDFDQDIYGAYNYAGNLIIEGLSVILPAQEDQRKIFYKLKHSLALKGYITIWADINTFIREKRLVEAVIFKTLKYLFRVKLNIEVFKGKDYLDIIRIYQTNGWNYDVSPNDVIKKLMAWQTISNFEITFASNSSFGVEFTRLPEDIDGFARDVAEFCPDVKNHKEVVKEIEKYKSIYLSWD